MTQEQRVIQRIKEFGYVDNFWAIENYILRLSSIMAKIKRLNKFEFEGKTGKELGKERKYWKNFYYTPKRSEPTLF